MARPLRIKFPGAFYHVMNRGNTEMIIFKTDRDRDKFLDYVGKAVNHFIKRLCRISAMAGERLAIVAVRGRQGYRKTRIP